MSSAASVSCAHLVICDRASVVSGRESEVVKVDGDCSRQRSK